MISRASTALAALTAALLAGCSDETAEPAEFQVITSITVDPVQFLGDLPCTENKGSLRSYVATVTDQTVGFTLPSSPPTSCGNRVSFRYVLPGHVYTAEVDGYPYLPDELSPFGGSDSGSRTMLLAGERIEPSWETSCHGDTDIGGTVARSQVIAVVDNCDALGGPGATGPTVIAIDAGAALLAIGCPEGATVSVTPESPELPPVTGIGCASSPIEYTEGLVPGQLYEFRLDTVAGGVAHSARCSARAQSGLTVSASCDPLAATGAVDVDLGALLTEAGHSCVADVGGFNATVTRLAGETQVPVIVSSGAVACGENLHVSPLYPDTYVINLVAQKPNPDDGAVFSAKCTATVEPASTSTASCQLTP